MLIRTLQHIRSIAKNVLHDKDRYGIETNPYADQTQSTQPKPKLAKAYQIVNDPCKNAEAQAEPVDDRGRRQTETAGAFLL